jgi:hypothetical protein
MSKLSWFKNSAGGLTLQCWYPEESTTYKHTQYTYTIPARWEAVADVFKAKRGDRYVVRLVTWSKNHNRRYHQYAAFSLREAMRMAKFLVGVQHDQ